jgi:hypothetical protein
VFLLNVFVVVVVVVVVYFVIDSVRKLLDTPSYVRFFSVFAALCTTRPCHGPNSRLRCPTEMSKKVSSFQKLILFRMRPEDLTR